MQLIATRRRGLSGQLTGQRQVQPRSLIVQPLAQISDRGLRIPGFSLALSRDVSICCLTDPFHCLMQISARPLLDVVASYLRDEETRRLSFKDILVHVDSTRASRERLRLALVLSKRFEARLTGLHVIPEPNVPPYFKPSVVERIAAIYAKNAREAAGLTKRLFDEEVNLASVTTAWECAEGDLEQQITQRARFADLTVMGQFDTENPPGISAFLLPAKIVFGTGAPILVIPNARADSALGSRIVAAWDGSREAVRAIRDAFPLLKSADAVSLLAVDLLQEGNLDHGSGISKFADHLARHGIPISVTEIASGKWHAANALLAHADEFRSDLLVMGAYGHSRILEFVMGGTTQDVLERSAIPVLMSR